MSSVSGFPVQKLKTFDADYRFVSSRDLFKELEETLERSANNWKEKKNKAVKQRAITMDFFVTVVVIVVTLVVLMLFTVVGGGNCV